MNLKEYQINAARTCPSLGSKEKDDLHMQLGIATEIGELLDIFKKNLAYKKDIDIINLAEEIADICFYIVNFLRINNEIIDNDCLYCPDYDVNDMTDNDEICAFLLDYSNYDLIQLLQILFAIAVHFELDFYKLLDNNINKLRVRFPHGFNEENALNRL